MGGFSSITGDESIMNADNASFDGTERNGKMTTNGELWIGSTASPHVKKGTLTSPDNSILVNYSAPNITLRSNPAVVPDLHTAKWIVNSTPNAGGNQATITAAIAAASSGDTIFVMPGATGTYTENFTLPAGINIVAFTGDGEVPNVTIIGKVTMTAAGTSSISNIRLQTNSDFSVVVSGNSASILNLNNCYLNCTNNTGISFTSSSASSKIMLDNCLGDVGTTGIAIYACSGSGALQNRFSIFTNTGASTTANTISSGSTDIFYCAFQNPCTSSGTATQTSLGTSFSTANQNVTSLTQGGSGPQSTVMCSIISGSAPAVSVGSATGSLVNCVINSSNTNAITGSGTLTFCGLNFTGTSSTNNVTTLAPLVFKGGFYQGNLTNTAPASGMIGEQIRSTVAVGSPVSLVSATSKTITSINLTAGVWDVSCICAFTTGGVATSCNASISLINNTNGTQGDNMAESSAVPVNGVTNQAVVVPSYILLLSTTTTVYMVGTMTFSVSGAAYGRISATRIA